MSNILLTGGRTPAALELARVFYKAGHTVFMAESLHGHLSQPSNTIEKNFFVPPPRQQTFAFINALKTIVIENKIDLLIPTGEELFYVAMGREQLPCAVFIEPLDKLKGLHNKWLFVINAIGNDLYAPETMYLNNQDELLHAFAHWRELVLKPVYSRFATQTLVLPVLKEVLYKLTVNSRSPWIAQDYIKGEKFSTYSICHNGRITAHTAYPYTITAEHGSALVFQHINHLRIFNWIKTFVEKNKFTGQIAFNFIQSSDGQVYGLECTPCVASGVHLLASHPNFAEAFLNPDMDCITPTSGRLSMLATDMLIHGLPMAVRKKQIGTWFSTFFTSRDVIFDIADLLPFLLQFRSALAYSKISRDLNTTPLEAATFDIEWDGE